MSTVASVPSTFSLLCRFTSFTFTSGSDVVCSFSQTTSSATKHCKVSTQNCKAATPTAVTFGSQQHLSATNNTTPLPSTAMTAAAQRQRNMQLLHVVVFLALLLAPNCTCHSSDDHHHHHGEGDYPHAHDNDRNPYFAPYLLPGELPEGRTKELFREDWRVIGYQLDSPDFTDKVAEVSKTIYSAYSHHGHLHSLAISTAAPTTLDGQAGECLLSLSFDLQSDSTLAPCCST
jgi:hypothetical protein